MNYYEPELINFSLDSSNRGPATGDDLLLDHVLLSTLLPSTDKCKAMIISHLISTTALVTNYMCSRLRRGPRTWVIFK